MPKPESRGPNTATEQRVVESWPSAELAESLEYFRDVSPAVAEEELMASIYTLESMRNARIAGLIKDLNKCQDESENAWLEKEIQELLASKEEWRSQMGLLVSALREIKEWQNTSTDEIVVESNPEADLPPSAN